MNNIVLECKNLCKTFVDGKAKLNVLCGVNLQIKRGSQVAIMGRSGSGKSTLLQLLGALDHPTSGKVYLNGKALDAINDYDMNLIRNKHIGFIYQQHHLLAEFSAVENVALPMLIGGVAPKQALLDAAHLISLVGLHNRNSHKPAKLSGGERQRVAIARSLAMRPDCVLADEPTGNLDAENAALVLQLMQKLNRERGTTLIVVTHDPEIAVQMDHTYNLQEGVLT